MKSVKMFDGHIMIGSGVTLTKLEAELKNIAKNIGGNYTNINRHLNHYQFTERDVGQTVL